MVLLVFSRTFFHLLGCSLPEAKKNFAPTFFGPRLFLRDLSSLYSPYIHALYIKFTTVLSVSDSKPHFCLRFDSRIVRMFQALPTVSAPAHVLPDDVTRFQGVHARKVPTAIDISLIAECPFHSEPDTSTTFSPSPRKSGTMYVMQHICPLAPQTNTKPLRTALLQLPGA